MILYFPVSALVTLFGNILQNPLDSRAKSDTQLMSLVVTFLSLLGQEAEQGGVHRMLGICSEFVRIAKLVIERAEKEQLSRRKRKTMDGKAATNGKGGKTGVGHNGEIPIPTTLEELSPPLRTGRSASFGPVTATSPSPDRPSPANLPQAHWPQEQHPMQNGEFEPYNLQDFMSMSGNPSPSLLMNVGFQQPLLPQDLFSLPMTLDWNWAEMSGGAYPSVENGNYDGMNGQFQ